MKIEILPEGIKYWLDALSFGALLGSLASLLPIASSLLTFIWMAIRIYETETVRRVLNRKGIDDGR